MLHLVVNVSLASMNLEQSPCFVCVCICDIGFEESGQPAVLLNGFWIYLTEYVQVEFVQFQNSPDNCFTVSKKVLKHSG